MKDWLLPGMEREARGNGWKVFSFPLIAFIIFEFLKPSHRFNNKYINFRRKASRTKRLIEKSSQCAIMFTSMDSILTFSTSARGQVWDLRPLI